MSLVGAQDFWLTGSRLYFQRDPLPDNTGALIEQPIVDFGRIDAVSPTMTPTVVNLLDSDGGMKRLVDQAMAQIDEKYSIKGSNLNMDNLALLFMGVPPTSFTQAATPITVSQKAFPGRLLKLKDANGVPVYGVTSITTVGASLVQGTDWEVVSLERGIIRMIATGSFATAASISITYVPRVISGLRRLLNPQTAAIVRGTGLLIWGRGLNTQQTVREARFSLSPSASTFSDSAFSDMSVDLNVLSDPTQAIPAGRLLYWLGTEPSLS